MTEIRIEDLPGLFESIAKVFVEKKDELCAMDANMGDGDLGLTMSKGYSAMPYKRKYCRKQYRKNFI